jgi:hypothetical protein
MTLAQQLLLAQGLYYALTGLWPVVHAGSFMAVTGPKKDLWLVKTVGLVLASIGASLIVASRDPVLTPETLTLALGSALALTGVDIVYSVKRVISFVYLGDAAAELALLWMWSVAAAGLHP